MFFLKDGSVYVGKGKEDRCYEHFKIATLIRIHQQKQNNDEAVKFVKNGGKLKSMVSAFKSGEEITLIKTGLGQSEGQALLSEAILIRLFRDDLKFNMLNAVSALPYLEPYFGQSSTEINELKTVVFNRFHSDFKTNRELIGFEKYRNLAEHMHPEFKIDSLTTDKKIENKYYLKSFGHNLYPTDHPIQTAIIYREYFTGKLLSREDQFELANEFLEEGNKMTNRDRWYEFYSKHQNHFESGDEEAVTISPAFDRRYDELYEAAISKDEYLYYLLQLSCKMVRFTYRHVFEDAVPQTSIAEFVNAQRSKESNLKFEKLKIPYKKNQHIFVIHNYFNHNKKRNKASKRCTKNVKLAEIDRHILQSERSIKLAFPDENFDRFQNALEVHLNPLVQEAKESVFRKLGLWYICKKAIVTDRKQKNPLAATLACLNSEIIRRHEGWRVLAINIRNGKSYYPSTITIFFNRECHVKSKLDKLTNEVNEKINNLLPRCLDFGDDRMGLDNLETRINTCLSQHRDYK